MTKTGKKRTLLVDDEAETSAIVKTEKYDEAALLWLLFKAKQEDLGPKWAAKPAAEFAELKRCIAAYHKAKGRVEYRYGKDAPPPPNEGRLCAVGGRGLQSFPRVIRGLLASDFYVDIDIKSAQPVLLELLAKQKGWKHKALADYNANRDEHMKSIMDTGATRDVAKKHTIALFFGQGQEATEAADLPEFFTEKLQPRLTQLRDNIYNDPEFVETRDALEAIVKRKRAKGERTSAVPLSLAALVLQSMERRCLLSIEKELKRNGRELDVYIHDGGLVRKLDDEDEFPEDLLRKCEAAVLKDLGYTIELVVKPMNSDIKIPEGALESMQMDVKLQEWQDTHKISYVKGPHRFTYFNFRTGSLEFMTRNDLLNMFENVTVEKTVIGVEGDAKLIEVPITKEWLRWTERCTYENAEFWPSPDVRPGVLNTFTGYAFERFTNDPAVITAAEGSEGVLLMELLFKRVCGGAAESLYCQQTMAKKLQSPLDPPRIAQIFNGDGGLGKDTLREFLMDFVFGLKLCAKSATPKKDFFGDFNPLLATALLAGWEEGSGADFYGVFELWKTMITATFNQINQKNEKLRQVESFVLWMISMNRPFGVPVEANDRRMVIYMATQHEDQNNWEWFTKVRAARADPSVIKYFALKWLSMDVKDVDLVKTRPISIAHKLACAQAVPREMQFMLHVLDILDGEAAAGDEEGVFKSNGDLYLEYRAWHTDHHGQAPTDSKTKFNANLEVMTGVNGLKFAGPSGSTAHPIAAYRKSDARGWKLYRSNTRVWMEAKGYLEKPKPLAVVAQAEVGGAAQAGGGDPSDIAAALADVEMDDGSMGDEDVDDPEYAERHHKGMLEVCYGVGNKSALKVKRAGATKEEVAAQKKAAALKSKKHWTAESFDQQAAARGNVRTGPLMTQQSLTWEPSASAVNSGPFTMVEVDDMLAEVET